MVEVLEPVELMLVAIEKRCCSRVRLLEFVYLVVWRVELWAAE